MGQRAAIYLRISDDREGRALGVERQDEDVRRLAKREGDTIVGVYKDNDIGASIKSRKPRPDYRRLLADARAGHFTKIIAYTSSRLTRRPREHEDQIELAQHYGITFAYVASPTFDLNTSAGRRVARSLAAHDAGEAEDISERVQRAKEQSALDGRYRGGRRPFGFESDGVTIRESEAELVRLAADAILAGDSLDSLARQFNDSGSTTTMGRAWTSVGVRRLLLRPRTAGLVEQHGEIVATAVWEPLVPPEKWRTVRSILTDPSRLTHTRTSMRWLGSSLFVCGVCGDVMRGAAVSGPAYKTGNAKMAYRCRARAHLSRAAQPVDDLVADVVIARLSRPDAVEMLTDDDNSEDLSALYARASTQRSKLDELTALYAEDAITARQLADGTSRINQTLADIESQIAEATSTSVLSGIVGVDDVKGAWDQLPVPRRKAIVDALMTVTLLKDHRRGRKPGGGYFDPELVQITWKM